MKKALRIVKKILIGTLITAAALFGIDIGLRQATQKSVPLTKEYVDVVRPILGDDVDYSKVRIMFGKVSSLQKDTRVMTIGNTIYYPPMYTPAPDDLFAHEMTHVWQQQNKIPQTGLSGVVNILFKYKSYNDAYAYVPDTSKKLTDYNLEQQAEMVQDYVIKKTLLQTHPTNQKLQEEVDVLAKIISTCLPIDTCADIHVANDKGKALEAPQKIVGIKPPAPKV